MDDYDYACQYIFFHKETESRRKIEEKLMQKGINKETFRQAVKDSYEEEEEQELELIQARKLLEKKKYNVEVMDWKEKQKACAFLVRKGIGTTIIKKVMSVQEWEEL